MNPLSLVKLTALMELTDGSPEIAVGLIDGPVDTDHHDLATRNIREIPGKLAGTCSQASGPACQHGTLVTAILCANRESGALAICPGCTLLVCPIFVEVPNAQVPRATPEELAEAIIETVDAGVRVINLSVTSIQPSSKGQRKLEEALDYAARYGVIPVVAAGNQGTVGSSVMTRHPWSVPVVACDSRGMPLNQSNLGGSIGRRGLGAPGENIPSLQAGGGLLSFGGTSAAAPFVTGAIALLWSEFPSATAAEIKLSITQAASSRRTTIVPPLLDAWGAFKTLQALYS